MTVSLVVALGHDLVIGDGQRMPWHLRADLRRFRRLTLGKAIVMGRKTFDSIGRPLPDRHNVVLTRRPLSLPGCHVVGTPDEALAVAGGLADEAVVIGGGEVYRLFLPAVERVHLTVVEGTFGGGVTFPLGELLARPWRVVAEESAEAGEHDSHAHRYFDLEPAADGRLGVGLPDLSVPSFNPIRHTRA